jgi:hypothetical protein
MTQEVRPKRRSQAVPILQALIDAERSGIAIRTLRHVFQLYPARKSRLTACPIDQKLVARKPMKGSNLAFIGTISPGPKLKETCGE